MKPTLKVGDRAEFVKLVTHDMTVEFEGRPLHEFCATYWLSHLAEYVSRMVLEPHLEDHEDGVGTGLYIRHYSPAGVGQAIRLVATCTELKGNYLKCDVDAHVGDRRISEAVVHQVVIPKSELEALERKLVLEKSSH